MKPIPVSKKKLASGPTRNCHPIQMKCKLNNIGVKKKQLDWWLKPLQEARGPTHVHTSCFPNAIGAGLKLYCPFCSYLFVLVPFAGIVPSAGMCPFAGLALFQGSWARLYLEEFTICPFFFCFLSSFGCFCKTSA